MQIKETITGSEPITATEVKSWLKVDFTDDDTLIAMLITSVRESLEKFTGLALIAKTVEYFNEEIESEILLPYPAHTAITEVKINGVISTSYVKTGLNQFIVFPNQVQSTMAIADAGIKITYTCTGTCPTALKTAMLKEIDEQYRNRGNTFEGSISQLSENTYAAAAKYCV